MKPTDCVAGETTDDGNASLWPYLCRWRLAISMRMAAGQLIRELERGPSRDVPPVPECPRFPSTWTSLATVLSTLDDLSEPEVDPALFEYARRSLHSTRTFIRAPGEPIDPDKAGTLAKSLEEVATRLGALADIVEHDLELGKPLGPIEIVDGPYAPDGWRHNGELFFGLKGVAWRFANALWRKRFQGILLQELAEEVLQDREVQVPPEKAGNWRRRANKFFKDHGIPFRSEIEKGYAVIRRAEESPAEDSASTQISEKAPD